MSQRTPIAINGTGRIALEIARRLTSDLQYRDKFVIRYMNDLNVDALDVKSRFNSDSIHGKAHSPAQRVGEDCLSIAGDDIQLTGEPDASKLDWGAKGVKYVIDATGVNANIVDARKHLDAGAEKVIVTQPFKGPEHPETPSITSVFGANHGEISKDHLIISAASCTTNCVVLPLYALRDLGVQEAYVDTIHAVTNTDVTVDGPKGKASALNIRLETTGAAKTAGLVLQMPEGSFDGLSVRVPVYDGSLSILDIFTEKSTTRSEVNALLKMAAEKDLQNILGYSEFDSDGDKISLSSSDIIGRTEGSIVSAHDTVVMNQGHMSKLYCWYDNEAGYAAQALRVLNHVNNLDM